MIDSIEGDACVLRPPRINLCDIFVQILMWLTPREATLRSSVFLSTSQSDSSLPTSPSRHQFLISLPSSNPRGQDQLKSNIPPRARNRWNSRWSGDDAGSLSVAILYHQWLVVRFLLHIKPTAPTIAVLINVESTPMTSSVVLSSPLSSSPPASEGDEMGSVEQRVVYV